MSINTQAQCNGQEVPSPSFHCSTAPVLCQIDCLDGFQGSMPDQLIQPQPDDLCNGGEANNMSWFAFVAGSDSINLTITPSNCSAIMIDGIGYRGIQVGIYNTCDFDVDDNEREFACETEASENPVMISSNNFVIGQTYYLFIDGNTGSVCDYEVTVNYGMQAFEMPEFTTASNQYNIDFDSDTLCVGGSVDVTLDGFTTDAEYHWSISPATSLYTNGLHPVTDTNVVTWEFTDPGAFEICVFASNFCDANDTLCFDIFVDTLVDEYFQEIEVCQECFPIILASADTTCVIGEVGTLFPTILTENPNGDGISGWLGFTQIIAPGLVSYEVPALYGCSYMQYVNIKSIPIKPRESVTLYKCANDYPFDYHGTSITGPVTNKFVTIDNAATTRCDSLVSLTVQSFGDSAKITEGDCKDGGVILHYSLNAPLPPGATIIYEWQFGGATITDSDGIDTTMLVTANGFYSVKATMTIDGVDCEIVRGSPFVDLDDLAPSIPSYGLFPQEYCDDGNEAMLFVENNGEIVSYEWSLVPPLSFDYGGTTDTIYIDISGNEGFQYCVEAYNECGRSSPICEVMAVTPMPSVTIDIPTETCIDSIFSVNYIGNADMGTSTFLWDIGSASLVSGNVNSSGPLSLRYGTAGQHDISLVVTEGACTTLPTTVSISVPMPGVIPQVDCQSLSQGVSFSIMDLPMSYTFSYVVLEGTYGDVSVSDDVISFVGMPADELLRIGITFITDCGDVYTEVGCTSIDCPVMAIELMMIADGLCYDSLVMDVQLEVTIDGLPPQVGEWTGAFIDEIGSFDAISAGVGEHTVGYTFTIDGCDYSDSLTFEILATPELTSFLITDECDVDAEMSIQLMSDIAGEYEMNGTISSNGLYANVEAGAYTAQVTTDEGCVDSIQIIVPVREVEFVSIQGEHKVEKDTESTYTISTTIEIPNNILWELNGVDICDMNCDSVTIEPEDGDELCVTVTYHELCELTDCIIIETYKATKVYFPNVFSPNGDGINDTFFPISNDDNLSIIKLVVFDRWGNEVFYMHNAIMSEHIVFWNGTFRGAASNVGVYVYMIEYLDESGMIQSKKGDISLVR